MDGTLRSHGWTVVLVLVLGGCFGGRTRAPAPEPAVAPAPPAAAAPGMDASLEAAQVRVRLGIQDLITGDRDLARTQFEKALALDPTHAEARRLLGLIRADDAGASRAAVLRGIELLNGGEPERARDVLIDALCSQPDNALARQLLGQIDADPRQVLGEPSFPYTVQPGESLSRIAQRFLGDRFQFYLLARYNGIDDPSRLRAGQVIQVPGSAPPAAVVPPPPADGAPPTVRAEPPGGEHPGPVELTLLAEDDRDPAPALYYTVDGSEPVIGEGARYRGPILLEVSATVRFLAVDRAGNASPTAVATYTLPGPVAAPPPTPSVAELYRAGQAAVERGEADAALVLFNQVLEREPGHTGALQARRKLTAAGVDDWYRQAYAALRRQRPRETVAYCDRVLAVAPDHRNAQVLRMQALDLIRRLVEVDLGEGRDALARGQRDEAAKRARRVLELDPDNAAARELLRRSAGQP